MVAIAQGTTDTRTATEWVRDFISDAEAVRIAMTTIGADPLYDDGRLSAAHEILERLEQDAQDAAGATS